MASDRNAAEQQVVELEDDIEKVTGQDDVLKENTILRAEVVKLGGCMYGYKKPGEHMNTCILGFPGCACADDLMAADALQAKENKSDA